MRQFQVRKYANMIEETGTVVGVFKSEIVVEVLRTSACQSCNARQGCGQAVMSEWGDSAKQQKKNHFKLSFTGSASVGDQVDLGMAHDTVSKVAMLIYLMPLAVGFIGLIIGYWLQLNELFQLVLFGLFFAFSLIFISRLNFNKSNELVPKILRLYPRSKEPDLIASTGSKSV
jgi:sigma-E factor negative regulatory protein RseC